ncbi:HdaA/DnaA family protein [Segnochrobactrum spirostomi]|uniref:Hda lid domain-containing protein n=1 Tax=Segnochrobactrum spirostomi TaxID=2608987 RepID=A0A6A7XX62_9HYPH|nr:hypothetical protein [Segnochrobactrum spirostomi]MQT11140.1 hypothetical protein [Segnochrobactrum spirostomi]
MTGDDRRVQLPLALPAAPALGRDDFLVGPTNAAAAELIDRWPGWPSRLVVLVGPAGSGKSHLVAVWRQHAGAEIVAAADLGGIDPIAAAAGPLAVEDVDSGPIAEVALFHLLNAAATGPGLLLTARTPPEEWSVRLPDLGSRLRAATRVTMQEADDDLLRRVVVKLFADRQFAVDPGVIDYLLARMERSLAAANRLVAEIDREALAQRRPVTRGLVAEVLARPIEGVA